LLSLRGGRKADAAISFPVISTEGLPTAGQSDGFILPILILPVSTGRWKYPLSSVINRGMNCKRQGHSVYYTRYHLVIATKYRRKILKDGFGEYLKKLVMGIGRRAPEIEIIDVNTDVDHIHMLLSIPPKMSISEVVKEVKAKTGLYMRRKFPFLDKVYWGQDGICSRGYFVSTVGIDEATIKRYIAMQGKEDSGQALLEF
jgi:putative transposase